MRLLILTQAVDLDDPVLGFFHRWIEELATQCESIHVICLRKGAYQLPENVSVHSLGKENDRTRLQYVQRFYTYVWTLRREYDSVFVHMNPEYVVLAGFLWRFLKKKITLWYIHPQTPLALRIAVPFVHAICTAVPSSLGLRSRKIHVVGHGIDIGLFKPDASSQKRDVLFLGRLDAVKNVHIFLAALNSLYDAGVQLSASMCGSPTVADSKYAQDVRSHAAEMGHKGALIVRDRIPHREAAALFAGHRIYVNLTPSGSFDKTIGEAMASGAIVVVANTAFAGIIPDELLCDLRSDDVARAIRRALELTDEEREHMSKSNRAYIEQHHALPSLVQKLVRVL